jgi:hypothetical protein
VSGGETVSESCSAPTAVGVDERGDVGLYPFFLGGAWMMVTWRFNERIGHGGATAFSWADGTE